jgi:C-terminal processing protease CtpA/Prc
MKSLSLGDLRLDNVLVTFFEQGAPGVPPCGENGLLGSGVLQRFTVTFDYANERMFLEPGGRFNEPFEFNMTGLAYRRAGDGTFEIVRVFPDTPASESGLVEGDMILSVDGVPARDCEEATMREIMKNETSVLRLRIARSGSEMDVALRPRRLI